MKAGYGYSRFMAALLGFAAASAVSSLSYAATTTRYYPGGSCRIMNAAGVTPAQEGFSAGAAAVPPNYYAYCPITHNATSTDSLSAKEISAVGAYSMYQASSCFLHAGQGVDPIANNPTDYVISWTSYSPDDWQRSSARDLGAASWSVTPGQRWFDMELLVVACKSAGLLHYVALATQTY